jgi:hypothetical protein
VATCSYSGDSTSDLPCGRPANQRVQVRADFPPGWVCRDHFIELLESGDYDAVCKRGHRKRAFRGGRLYCPDCQAEYQRRYAGHRPGNRSRA